MEEKTTLETVKRAIHEVEHPEIAASLHDLGMVDEITFDETEGKVSLTLLLPTLGIPEQVRNYILSSIARALQPLSVKDLQYQVAEMEEEAKRNFFARAQANWKL
jgi:metal-sulfur cluster biosynthetic enzyme